MVSTGDKELVKDNTMLIKVKMLKIATTCLILSCEATVTL